MLLGGEGGPHIVDADLAQESSRGPTESSRRVEVLPQLKLSFSPFSERN